MTLESGGWNVLVLSTWAVDRRKAIIMSKAKRRKVDRHTTLSCISVSESRIDGKRKNNIIAALKHNGWGVVTEKARYRFLHFDKQTESDVLQVLDNIDCNEEG